MILLHRCQPYLACSHDSQEGFCAHVDTTCTAQTRDMNTCRTCGGFTDEGGGCSALNYFPNATVAEYGLVGGSTDEERVLRIKSEIKLRVSILFCSIVYSVFKCHVDIILT